MVVLILDEAVGECQERIFSEELLILLTHKLHQLSIVILQLDYFRMAHGAIDVDVSGFCDFGAFTVQESLPHPWVPEQEKQEEKSSDQG